VGLTRALSITVGSLSGTMPVKETVLVVKYTGGWQGGRIEIWSNSRELSNGEAYQWAGFFRG